jgi:hypothetical protein
MGKTFELPKELHLAGARTLCEEARDKIIVLVESDYNIKTCQPFKEELFKFLHGWLRTNQPQLKKDSR